MKTRTVKSGALGQTRDITHSAGGRVSWNSNGEIVSVGAYTMEDEQVSFNVKAHGGFTERQAAVAFACAFEGYGCAELLCNSPMSERRVHDAIALVPQSLRLLDVRFKSLTGVGLEQVDKKTVKETAAETAGLVVGLQVIAEAVRENASELSAKIKPGDLSPAELNVEASSTHEFYSRRLPEALEERARILNTRAIDSLGGHVELRQAYGRLKDNLRERFPDYKRKK